MPFPSVDRVIYKNNPLDRVVCQLRYPPILRIETQIPTEFQEIIRNLYPLYTEKNEYRIERNTNLSHHLKPGIIQSIEKSSLNKNHEFMSEDGIWKINLTKTFISITTSKYERWESFKDKFILPFEALINIYKPPFFTRLGLRYIDIFNRSKLLLKDTEWCDLLKPHFLGLIASPIKESIKNFNSGYDILLADNESYVKIMTSFVEHLDTKELCFMADSDFYNNKKNNKDIIFDKLDFLNIRSSRLIQWMILDKLHNAMEPSKI